MVNDGNRCHSKVRDDDDDMPYFFQISFDLYVNLQIDLKMTPNHQTC